MPTIDGPVIALDLASRTGWCTGAPGGRARVGTIAFAPSRAKGATEELFHAALLWLQSELPGHALVAFETPLAPSSRYGATNIDAVRIAFGLAALVEAAARGAGIKVVEAPVSAVRTFMIGRGNLAGKIAKPLVWQRCRALGIECEDHDQSDAAALWFYVCALFDPRTAARSTPLFGRGEGNEQ